VLEALVTLLYDGADGLGVAHVDSHVDGLYSRAIAEVRAHLIHDIWAASDRDEKAAKAGGKAKADGKATVRVFPFQDKTRCWEELQRLIP
jgi:hypothetical protein